MHRYYCVMRPPAPGAIPRSRKMGNFEAFTERRYIPEIDRMAWGWVEYMYPLTPAEIADYELISAPKEDEV